MTPRSAYFVVWRLGEVGGMERHFCDLAIALHDRGTDVTVFVEQPLLVDNRYARALRSQGITVIKPSLATRFAMRVEHSWPYRKATSWRRESPATFALLSALNWQSRQVLPDVVHVHGCQLAQRAVLQWAKARNIPAAYTEHITIADWHGPHDANSPEVFEDAAAAIACVSERSRESLVRYMRSPVALATHIVPDPAIPPINPSAVRPLNMLSVGRLEACKGHHVLLHAAAILRDRGVPFSLLIAGDGEERVKLERLRSELRLEREVTFAGLVDQDAIASLWADADLGVLPSLTESLPIALVEAFAAGRPVVATDVGGVSEALSDGVEGFLVSAEDGQALAEAIIRCTDRGLVARMGLAARDRYERGPWSPQHAVERTVALYTFAKTFRHEAAEPFYDRYRKEHLTHETPLTIAMCIYRLAVDGVMERRVMRQAIALADTGVGVTLHVEQPVHPFNCGRRALTGAGVRIEAPTTLGWIASRCWAAMTGGVGGLPNALARTIRLDSTDAVHVHGWRCGAGWRALDGIVLSLAKSNVRMVYEEHAPLDDPMPGHLAVLRSFDALVAPSPAASNAMDAALGSGHPPIFIIDALDELPWAPAARSKTVATLKLFILAEAAAADKVKAAPNIRIVDDLTSSDAVVLTPAVSGYASALSVAMASFKPVILTHRDAEGPIRHRVNGLIARDLNEALETLRIDPLLAHQFAVAARRTYNAGGHDRPAIAAQLTALYRPAPQATTNACR